MFGSLLMSSRMDMLDDVLKKSGSSSLLNVSSISFAERLIFLGTELSFAIYSNFCLHSSMTCSKFDMWDHLDKLKVKIRLLNSFLNNYIL